MIAITGATGQLGQHVIENLLKTIPASQMVAIVRNPAKATALSQQGITVRQADYSDEATFTQALQGVDKLLLISSSEVGQRAAQHRNVINAAKAANVKFIAYTSLLHADRSPLALHVEHVDTEKMLADSGIAHALLRNGWYTETISPAPLLRWCMACLSALRARAELPPRHARITPPPPHRSSAPKAMPGRCMNWRVMNPGR